MPVLKTPGMERPIAFRTTRADVYFVDKGLAQPYQDYLIANKKRLASLEPLRRPEYYELANIKEQIEAMDNDFILKRGLYLLFTPKESLQVIGSINFTGFMYGVFQAGYVGFSIDQDFEGQGIMIEVLQASLNYVRQHYGLHRIMANHLPHNERSAALLHRLGFEKEGYAKSYLKINGQWQDHVLTALVFED